MFDFENSIPNSLLQVLIKSSMKPQLKSLKLRPKKRMKVIEPLQDLVTVLSQIPNLRLLKWSKNNLRGQLRPWKSAKTMEVAVKRVIIWCGYWISNWIFSTSQKPLTRTKVSKTLPGIFNVSTLSKPKAFTSKTCIQGFFKYSYSIFRQIAHIF